MAKITFRPKVVEALRETADRFGLSMEETANNAVLVYRDMVLYEQRTGADCTHEDAFSSFICSTELARK